MTADPQRFGTEAFYASIGRAFLAMCAFVPVLWLIELLDIALAGGLDRLGGIEPRALRGLDGIVLAPFLHGGFAHLAANSVPLILLGTFVLAGQTKRFLLLTAFIAVVSGLGVWVIGPSNTLTIGASGVIFGYLGYLLVAGIVERSLWRVGVGLLVGLLYGWQIIGVLPDQANPQVSWQGHLFGFIGGMVAALLFRPRRKPGVSAPAYPPARAGDTVPLPGRDATIRITD